MKFDGIIFDLDGTLWNAIEGVCSSWNQVLSKYEDTNKRITPEDMEKCMGLQIGDIGKKLFPDLDEAFRMKLIKECCHTEQIYLGEHGGKLYPNLEETLKKLKENHSLYIVSNCQDGYIQCFYKAHKLNRYFNDIECSGVTGLPKGENIRLIAERNNLSNPIYIGDTTGDAQAAKSAGIPFIYARYGFGKVEEYDYAIDTFEQILTLGL